MSLLESSARFYWMRSAMGISDWPEEQRPRERLLRDGEQALSDAELLAIFLRVGLPGKSAVDLARELLAAFDGSLARLATASLDALRARPGVGLAKAAQLKATLELARRALREEMASRDLLSSPRQVRDYLRLKLAALPHECFMILLLDAQNRLLRAEELFRGTLTQTSVYPREIVKLALTHNAAAIILAHNHPSGVAEPSRADELLTQTLKQALALVDVKVLDHFIIAGNAPPLSFAERGLL
jgi:DNA repair protein RadC